MKYPLDEMLDKRSIIQLKLERVEDEEDRKKLTKEFSDYTFGVTEYIHQGYCTKEQIDEWASELYKINEKIWNLETDIRKGQIGDTSLEEVGKTAIKIRELNGIRVRIKSKIAKKIGIGYEDIKINHASQL